MFLIKFIEHIKIFILKYCLLLKVIVFYVWLLLHIQLNSNNDMRIFLKIQKICFFFQNNRNNL